jgi:hypothetical protein
VTLSVAQEFVGLISATWHGWVLLRDVRRNLDRPPVVGIVPASDDLDRTVPAYDLTDAADLSTALGSAARMGIGVRNGIGVRKTMLFMIPRTPTLLCGMLDGRRYWLRCQNPRGEQPDIRCYHYDLAYNEWMYEGGFEKQPKYQEFCDDLLWVSVLPAHQIPNRVDSSHA